MPVPSNVAAKPQGRSYSLQATPELSTPLINTSSNQILLKMNKLKKGENKLKEPLIVKDAKDVMFDKQGTIITNWSLEFDKCKNVTLRHLSLIHGDKAVTDKNDDEDRDKPKNSVGLDCLSFKECSGTILIENCSFIASCDELISVVSCDLDCQVIVKNCLFAFPLAANGLHPYGRDKHAYCSNNSAVNIVYVDCVFVGFIMRGPQFECSDTQKKQVVRMGVYNSIMYSYHHSATKLRTAPEKEKSEGGRSPIERLVTNENKNKFFFSVVGNIYSNPELLNADEFDKDDTGCPIQLDNSFGVLSSKDLKIHIANNWLVSEKEKKEFDEQNKRLVEDAKDSPRIDRKKLCSNEDDVLSFFSEHVNAADIVKVDESNINATFEIILSNVGTGSDLDKSIIDLVRKGMRVRICRKLSDIQKMIK